MWFCSSVVVRERERRLSGMDVVLEVCEMPGTDVPSGMGFERAVDRDGGFVDLLPWIWFGLAVRCVLGPWIWFDRVASCAKALKESLSWPCESALG